MSRSTKYKKLADFNKCSNWTNTHFVQFFRQILVHFQSVKYNDPPHNKKPKSAFITHRMQIESATKQRVPRHVYTRKSNKERRQNVIPLIKRTMTRGLCRHRTARAKGPKRTILVWRLTLLQKCERDVKNSEPVAVVAFCRRATSVARARGKRVSLKNWRTSCKTRNYLFKGFYPFLRSFLSDNRSPDIINSFKRSDGDLFLGLCVRYSHRIRRGGAEFTLPAGFLTVKKIASTRLWLISQ